jgi:hypothetical protein
MPHRVNNRPVQPKPNGTAKHMTPKYGRGVMSYGIRPECLACNLITGETTMTHDITIRGEFTAIRTSKSGKETHRGILGVLTSGNKAECYSLASVGIEHALENNNYRAIMREVTRVFPASTTFKNSTNAIYNKKSDEVVGAIKIAQAKRLKKPLDSLPRKANDSVMRSVHPE